jgi:hypothetical protein
MSALRVQMDARQPKRRDVENQRRQSCSRNRISHKGQNAKLPANKTGGTGAGEPGNGEHFAGSNKTVKLVRSVAKLVRRARLDYEGFRRLSADVRKELGLHCPPRSRRLPQVMPEASLKKFFDAMRQDGNLQHEIILKLLFFTATFGNLPAPCRRCDDLA